MKIFENDINNTLNNEKYYNAGMESVSMALELAIDMKNNYSDNVDFYLYWIGNNLSYKHSVVLKSFLATQNLEKTRLFVYSDVDISNNNYIKDYLKFDNIEFKIFDVLRESNGTMLENFQLNQLIKRHSFNPALESDYFRLLMLNKYGGVYIDFDVLLLRDFSPLLNDEFMYQWENYPSYNWINGAVMRLKKGSKLSTELIKEMMITKPISGSLCWASDIYCKVREYDKKWLIYPGAFFNSEWQYGTPINPFGIYELTNEMFDGAFSWHWHNKWHQHITTGSKFDILDNRFDNILKNKSININV